MKPQKMASKLLDLRQSNLLLKDCIELCYITFAKPNGNRCTVMPDIHCASDCLLFTFGIRDASGSVLLKEIHGIPYPEKCVNGAITTKFVNWYRSKGINETFHGFLRVSIAEHEIVKSIAFERLHRIECVRLRCICDCKDRFSSTISSKPISFQNHSHRVFGLSLAQQKGTDNRCNRTDRLNPVCSYGWIKVRRVDPVVPTNSCCSRSNQNCIAGDRSCHYGFAADSQPRTCASVITVLRAATSAATIVQRADALDASAASREVSADSFAVVTASIAALAWASAASALRFAWAACSMAASITRGSVGSYCDGHDIPLSPGALLICYFSIALWQHIALKKL